MAAIKGGGKSQLKIASIGTKLASAVTVRVGFLENATYPDGKPVAMIAAIQNYGAPAAGIPPRPFFTTMVRTKKGEWGPAVAALLKANDYDGEKTLAQTGQAISGQLRQSIIDTNAPPLARSTLTKRGVDPNTKYDPANPKTFGAKPLVDTGHMLGSVDYEVKA